MSFHNLFGVVLSVLLAGSANAGFIAVFSDDGSGGVNLSVTGSGQFLDNGPGTNITLTNIGDFLNATSTDFAADSISGTLTVDGSTIAIDGIEVQADATAVGDDILINNAGTLGDGANTGGGTLGNYVFNLSANWDSTNLAFSSLNPGSFGPGTGTDTPEFDSVSITVNSAAVPEPSSMLLIGMAAAGLYGFRRRKQRQQA